MTVCGINPKCVCLLFYIFYIVTFYIVIISFLSLTREHVKLIWKEWPAWNAASPAKKKTRKAEYCMV